MTLPVTHVVFTRARPEEEARGLLGYAMVTFDDGLDVDGVTVHLTREGKYSISFRKIRDRVGIGRFIARPRNPAARDAIENQVLAELRKQRHLA